MVFTFLLITTFLLFLGSIFYAGYVQGKKSLLKPEAPEYITTVEPNEYANIVDAQRSVASAFEIERRRIERDLHDGVQQYLVATSMDIGEALWELENWKPNGGEELVNEISQLRERLESAQQRADYALAALRTTVHGIHPKVLSDIGLEAAVRDIIASTPADISLHVPHPLPNLPDGVVATAYFTVSEIVTNAVKYAPGSRMEIMMIAGNDLTITMSDTGPGGAKIRTGGGLAGIGERLAILGGHMEVISPEGGPTIIHVQIPLMLHRGEFGVNVDMENEGK